ncbi:formate dehydrogenase accessory sulfurtransferase FdhD [Paracraurococcus lichenis]|uniref:Sulfur carrier protein FdhD n=1 Tax=Paracraurococcus lichenis TaxID=3064888 RepID=A0ABT9E323_9PROT|nr:formate dehydrogenase accessory sulfurtransferase FdhD [Paracraurococcus sp. LOR1-02]MDO9710553.1 formate dehydrogenase accessory sulfurtransferase FdhD [Paracraurococcus sp. LOR1-02]
MGAVPARAVVLPFEGEPEHGERAVPEEVAVNIAYASVPFAVMMATPADLEDFAYGFSLTEGVIGAAADIRGVVVEEEERGLRLTVNLAPARLHAHLSRRRAMVGRTGCGLCGIEALEDLPEAPRAAGPAPRLALGAVRRALAALEARQPLGDATRGVHAAAFADGAGRLVLVREDVGRHNALDKLAGAMLRGGIAAADGFVLVTSRCSFEMVEKTAMLGARALVAISAPTSLALERARHHDMTLLAIARRDAVTVFHGAERVLTEAVPA